jgi:hypothetical protein
MESNGNKKVDQASSNQIGDVNERWTGVEKLVEAGGVAPSAADKPNESRPLFLWPLIFRDFCLQ